MNSNLKKKCLSFICSASLVTGLTVSPAGSVFGYTAGFTVYAEGEAEGETIKTEAMGIFLTLLLGSGFRMVGSFANQAQALGQQFDNWVAQTQATITAGTIVAGTMFQNGWMKLSSDVVNAYNSFAGWLTETLSIPTTGTVDVPMGSGIGTYQTLPYSSNTNTIPTNAIKIAVATNDSSIELYSWNRLENADVRYTVFDNTIYYVTPKENDFNIRMLNTQGAGANLTTVTSTVGNYKIRRSTNRVSNINFTYINSLNSADYPGLDQYQLAVSLTYGDAALNDQILTGESLDLKDGIGLDQDQALLYDISALAEYAGVLDQTLTDAQDLVGVLTNSIARSKADADEDEDAEVLPWDLVDEDTDSKVVPDDITDTPPNISGQYKILGLEKMFPFSIPFDIYYFIKMFNAPAQPLEFDIPFVVTGVINQNYHVDLSIFNPVAEIFRLMILVGFIWFLITKTRDFLRS